jgi:hypothetical protein
MHDNKPQYYATVCMTNLLGCIETANGKIDVKWFIWAGIHSMH